MPPFLHGHDMRQSTPPPVESPLPRTPRPKRFLSPPKTPLPGLREVFGPSTPRASLGPAATLEAGLALERPSSACSNYSDTSDSSVDSNMTYVTADGSQTSVEDELDLAFYLPEEATLKPTTPYTPHTPVATYQPAASTVKKNRRAKIPWTEEMDAHLWKTYTLYQADPKITPFFVLPGQVPPLGVCCKVARETKRSWKAARLAGGMKATPRAAKRAPDANKADALRKMNPYSFPASESSTRRRLRELCRETYGPSCNQFHARGAGASARASPSPRKQDPFADSRNMALSLTTSTSASMRPSGMLAALASGAEVHTPPPPETAESSTETTPRPIIRRTPSPPPHFATPVLLPPLELSSSRSPYGTWPRRLKRPDQSEEESPFQPRHRRRGTLHDLFGAESMAPASAPAKTRSRVRGYTISAGTNPFATTSATARKRIRPSAPLLTVTGPVSFEGAPREGESPLTRRFGGLQDEEARSPRRLGSPFCERFGKN